jgi:serine/threonine protein kinase
VFLAMEFIAGGTIKSWLDASPHVAPGAGGVHRGGARPGRRARGRARPPRLQADNVLLDKEGRPRVVDFGIARQAAGSTPTTTTRRRRAPMIRRDAARIDERQHRAAADADQDRDAGRHARVHGARAVLGERGDERSDQFSFCVALYEALYGVRPFAGNDFSASR